MVYMYINIYTAGVSVMVCAANSYSTTCVCDFSLLSLFSCHGALHDDVRDSRHTTSSYSQLVDY